MCYTNILQILDLSQFLYDQKTEQWIIHLLWVIITVLIMRTLAPLFDMFYIGEGETVFNQLLDAYKEWKNSGKSRKEFLEIVKLSVFMYLLSMKQPTMRTEPLLL